jgi:hypothetical protein
MRWLRRIEKASSENYTADFITEKFRTIPAAVFGRNDRFGDISCRN